MRCLPSITMATTPVSPHRGLRLTQRPSKVTRQHRSISQVVATTRSVCFSVFLDNVSPKPRLLLFTRCSQFQDPKQRRRKKKKENVHRTTAARCGRPKYRKFTSWPHFGVRALRCRLLNAMSSASRWSRTKVFQTKGQAEGLKGLVRPLDSLSYRCQPKHSDHRSIQQSLKLNGEKKSRSL